ncbi:site-specific integrase [Enterococcus sp. LJL90]
MANIKKYTKKDGSSAYQFNAYLGVDPLTGKSKRTTRRGFKTQKEAKLALAQLQLEVEAKGFQTQTFATFQELYDFWFLQYSNTVKKSTANRVMYLFKNQILPTMGDWRLNKISIQACQSAMNDWASKFPATYRSMKSYSQRLLNYAIEIQLIQFNPMEKVILPKIKRKSKLDNKGYLDKDELIKFLEEVQQNEEFSVYAIFRMLAFTGMRKGELFALTWSDLDFKEQTISISKTASYLERSKILTDTKTEGSERIISIDEVTLSILKKWKLEQKKLLLSRGLRIESDLNQLVFSNDKNELYYNAFLNGILRRYNAYNITPHSFRHTHASLLFESGATIKQVQDRLGHTEVTTTLNIYTHVTKTAEKNTAINFLKFMES